MFKEFREFAVKGNVMDMAVGIIIGAAFGKIVSSLVEDIIMPPIGLLLGKVDFANLYINLSGQQWESVEAAKAAGADHPLWGLPEPDHQLPGSRLRRLSPREGGQPSST